MLKRLATLFFAIALVVNAVTPGVVFANGEADDPDTYEEEEAYELEISLDEEVPEEVEVDEADEVDEEVDVDDEVNEETDVNEEVEEEAPEEEDVDEVDEEESDVDEEELEEEVSDEVEDEEEVETLEEELEVEEEIEEEEEDSDGWTQAEIDEFEELNVENGEQWYRALELLSIAIEFVEEEDTPEDVRATVLSLVNLFNELQEEYWALIDEVEEGQVTFEEARARLIANTEGYTSIIEELEDLLPDDLIPPVDEEGWTDEQHAQFAARVAEIEEMLNAGNIATANQVLATLLAIPFAADHPFTIYLEGLVSVEDALAELLAEIVALVAADEDGDLSFGAVMRELDGIALEVEEINDILKNAVALAPEATANITIYSNARDHLLFLEEFFDIADGTRYYSRDDVVVINARDCDFELTIGEIYELIDLYAELVNVIMENYGIYDSYFDGTALGDTVAALATNNADINALIGSIESLLGQTIDCEPLTDGGGGRRPGGGGGAGTGGAGAGGDGAGTDGTGADGGAGTGGDVLPQLGVATSSTALAGVALAGAGVAAIVIKKRKK